MGCWLPPEKNRQRNRNLLTETSYKRKTIKTSLDIGISKLSELPSCCDIFFVLLISGCIFIFSALSKICITFSKFYFSKNILKSRVYCFLRHFLNKAHERKLFLLSPSLNFMQSYLFVSCSTSGIREVTCSLFPFHPIKNKFLYFAQK